MTPLGDKLLALYKRCMSLDIEINEHKTVYQPIGDLIADHLITMPDPDRELPKDIRAGMIEKDNFVWIQAHPDNPVGFYQTFHWDLEMALEEILKQMREDGVDV